MRVARAEIPVLPAGHPVLRGTARTAARLALALGTLTMALALLAPPSSADTKLVKDIIPGSGSSYPGGLTNVGGRLYFGANDGIHGNELWASDGTDAGTTLVKDINPGSASSSPSELTDINGTLYFTANDGTHGNELWRSDGTAAGTTLVKDINPGSASSSPSYLTNVNGTLFFMADDGTHGDELWASDGTAAGTVLVSDINPGSASSYPSYLTDVNGTLYFAAYRAGYGTELWTNDGTTTLARLVEDINVGSGSSNPSNLTNVNGTLYFTADDGSHGRELWKSNGTAATTMLVKDIYPGGIGSDPSELVNVSGTLFLTANNGTGYGLWKSDGTGAGTNQFTLDPASWLTNVNGTLFFDSPTIGLGEDLGEELWKSDGTTVTFVKDINPGSASSSPSYLTNVNGTLYLIANDAAHGTELWTSDGTAAGTTLVSDINPGSGNSDPAFLTNVDGTLYFAADDGAHGAELWSFRPSLTISRDGGGAGSVTSPASGIDCGPECSRDYAIGDMVTLQASPGSNSTFRGWSGACSGANLTCTVPMTADRTVTATFAPVPHTLSVSRVGSGSGTVTSLPIGIDCGSSCRQSFAGTVTLQATPTSNSTFSGWSGGGCSGTGTCTLTMDSDAAVTATFTANPLPVVSLTGLAIASRKVAITGRRVRHQCVKPTKNNSRSARCRRPIRLRIRFTLNIPATVKIALKKQLQGRRVSGQCVRPTRKNRIHKKCTRSVGVSGSLSQTGEAGSNSFTWNGRIGPGTLPSGTYMLIATPIANGQPGAPRQTAFKLVG